GGVRSRFGGGALADPLQLRQVVALAVAHEEILLVVALLALGGNRPAVVNRDLARAGDLELLPVHDDRGALVEADAEHLGVLRDHLFEIVLAVAGQHVLIDRDTLDQAEALFVAGRHHDVVVLMRAAYHVRREDRGAGRRSADHAAALEQALDLTLRPRVQVRIDETPLPAAGKPDRARRGERTDERLGIGDLAIG